jgi:hypothetical protein
MALSAVNGQFFDFTCLQLRLNKATSRGSQSGPSSGLDVIEFNAISYSQRLTPEFVRGAHAQPVGRTRGLYEAGGSITLYKAAAAALIKHLGPGYMEREFDLTLSYGNQPRGFDSGPGSGSAFGNDLVLVTDELLGCRIKNDANSHSVGARALESRLELSIMRLKLNGVEAVGSMPF